MGNRSVRKMSLAISASAALMLGGCGGGSDAPSSTEFGVVCTTEARTSIAIATVDSLDGNPVPISSVTVNQIDGPLASRYSGTRLASDPRGTTRDPDGTLSPLQISSIASQATLSNLVGEFDVVVRADGYDDYVANGISVQWTGDGCYKPIEAVQLLANLVRRS